MKIIILILLCFNFVSAQDNYSSVKGHKQYELSNHLDNVLVTITDRNLDSIYRFDFNGKESDDELSGDGNQYDYGFRIYNPRLPKFLNVDPLTNSYTWYTPYQFAGNKPIYSIDLDGIEAVIQIYGLSSWLYVALFPGESGTSKGSN